MDSGAVIDTSTNTHDVPISAGDLPDAIAVSPDGTEVYIANSGGTVWVVDTTVDGDDVLPVKVQVGSTPFALAVSPDGRNVYFANFDSHTVSAIDAATKTTGNPVKVGTLPTAVTVSPDGKHVYVGMISGGLSVIDTGASWPCTQPPGTGLTAAV